jgi:anhydro-N-acetylmuramic acid kinase
MLAAPLAEVAQQLAADLKRDGAPEPLVIGLVEPGLWRIDERTWPTYLELVDPAPLAEATGLSVIDAFPARDLAGGGQGGPVMAAPKWLLMGDVHRRRVLVDLGRTSRIVVCPPLFQRTQTGDVSQTELTAPSAVLATDVGPGTALLDALASRIPDHKLGYDPGGRLAVQGRQSPELMQKLQGAPYFQAPLPRWNPGGAAVEWFAEAAVRFAVESDRSMRDVLCTATHFIAQTLAETIRGCAPPGAAPPELVLTGGGTQNGFLLREIAHRLPEYPRIALAALGIDPDFLDPAAAAMLAIMHLDQTPATQTLITGISTPRVLGRLTPGSPGNWRRLIELVADNPAQTMPLRSAV